MKKILLLAGAALLLIASPVMAKEGFYIGLFYPTETIGGDAGTGTESGGGYGFRAGFGFSKYVAIDAHYSNTNHDVTGGSSFDLTSFAGDVKLNFPLTSLDSAKVMTVEPYIMGGYAHYESSSGTKPKSDGFQYGIGVELYLFRELSINLGWTKTTVSFDTTPKREGDVKTIDFGIMYHFI